MRSYPYKQTIRLKPTLLVAHFSLGTDYGKSGMYKEAKAAFKQTIRLKPDYAEAHLGLGLVYLQSGNNGAALDEYKILKELDKDLANKLFDMIYK